MSERILKVNKKLRHEVSKLINSTIKTEAIITVTKVETTMDLKSAIVWISIYGGEERESLNEIEEKRKEIQKIINKNMFSKKVPLLSFEIDHSAAYAQRIDEILKNEKNQS